MLITLCLTIAGYHFQELIEAREAKRLNISRTQYSRASALKLSLLGGSLIILGPLIGWWGYHHTTSEGGLGIAMLVAIFLVVGGFCLPKGKSEYADLEKRQITELGWYLIFPPLGTETPFTDFSEVVVRHVCHPGGEADDTYTGSVGLKRKAGGPVRWIKEFPATKDEMPTEPVRYAKELSDLLGLPYSQPDPNLHQDNG